MIVSSSLAALANDIRTDTVKVFVGHGGAFRLAAVKLGVLEPESTAGAGYVAPRIQSEERFAAIWSDLLGVERVGAEDSFFELGGHSLLATRLVSRLREVCHVEIPLRASADFTSPLSSSSATASSMPSTWTTSSPPFWAAAGR